MDRNKGSTTTITTCIVVALRKESVDRNSGVDFAQDWLDAVALRKESVDRNAMSRLVRSLRVWSLSARRAWIEIQPFWSAY